MIPFFFASDAERTVLLLAMFLALVLMLSLLFITFGKKAQRAIWAINAVAFVMLSLLLVILCAENEYIDTGLPLIYHSTIPINTFWIVTIIFGTYVICSILIVAYRRTHTVDRNSIKEAMDTLPVGICFFNVKGMVKLCNLEMYRLFRTLAQSDLQSLQELHAAIAECDASTGVIRLSGDEPVYLFPDGKAWLFTETEVTAADSRRYTEAVFYDVTELYEKKRELEAQTVKLKELGKNIRRLSENVVAMTREEEMLSFKTDLHDRMGAGLIAARKVLTQNRSSSETDELIRQWKRSVELFRQDNGAPYERGDLPDLLRDAAAISVNIIIDGELPPNGEARNVLINAMRECLTNCARHANGTEMTAEIAKRGKNYTLTITNNGTPPSKTIVLGGGLSNLKRRVDYFGGAMEIESQPRFLLRVTIPMEEGIVR